MVRVLVIEDSSILQNRMKHILRSEPEILIVGVAGNGYTAIEMIPRIKPDLVLVDIELQQADIFQTTRKILKFHRIPILIASADRPSGEIAASFKAIEVGAVALVQKPINPDSTDFKSRKTRLVETIKLMLQVNVVRHGLSKSLTPYRVETSKKRNEITHIVAIGASTGAPPVIASILAGLPENFPMPILIVQHISPGFVHGFADWLNRVSRIPVSVAANLENIMNGRIYLAPDKYHMGVDQFAHIKLSSEPPEFGLRPTVSRLFHSVNSVYGDKAVGILLTGMGRDGAAELKQMRDSGALTIAQNEKTCVVYGMPGEAVKINAAKRILPPEGIVQALRDYARGV